MKIAITGATGFLGKYLVKHLLNCAYDVLVIARPEEDAKNCFSFEIALYETEYLLDDLTIAFKGVDTVIHLAAQTMQRDSSPDKVSPFFNANVKLVETVFLASLEAGVKQVVQTSTNSVYSSKNSLPFKESENPFPATVYGLSKLYAEKFGEYIASRNEISIVSLRLARLFGFGERESVVFTKYMKLANNKDILEVWGKGSTRIEYLYVKDAVDAIETCVRRGLASGIFNTGTNISTSVLEIAQLINSICENTGNIFLDESKIDVGYNILMDSSKFYNLTNWKSKWKLKEAIEDFYSYEKEENNG